MLTKRTAITKHSQTEYSRFDDDGMITKLAPKHNCDSVCTSTDCRGDDAVISSSPADDRSVTGMPSSIALE